MRTYFDSSAFAKRYVEENGTAEVLALCGRARELLLSAIAVPELVSAFCRLRRERRLTAAEYKRVKHDLLTDIADALICETNPLVIRQAVVVLEAHALRGMDAIHVGAAIVYRAELFVSADVRQCSAAKSAGLRAALV